MSLVARLAAVALVLSATAAAAVPAHAHAQSAANSLRSAPSAAAASAAPGRDAPVAVAPVSLTPRTERLAAGVREPTAPPTRDPVPAPKERGKGDTAENKALMIVGGAGLLVGAIIGGDAGTLIMVAGAAVGLYGLYKFLQ